MIYYYENDLLNSIFKNPKRSKQCRTCDVSDVSEGPGPDEALHHLQSPGTPGSQVEQSLAMLVLMGRK